MIEAEAKVVCDFLINCNVLGKASGELLNVGMGEEAWRTSGLILELQVKSEMVRYRVTNETRTLQRLGKWFTLTNPKTLGKELFVNNYAFPGGIGKANFIHQVTVPVGTKIHLGPAALNKYGPGGGFQAYIEGFSELKNLTTI